LIRTWAALASWMPRLVNMTTQMPVLRDIAKVVAGMPRERRVPAFAPQTFRQWFARRQPSSSAAGEPVMLWPDTFNDHFHPEALIAAVDVLERAGYAVCIPPRPVCCGRPLYDFGMLAAAQQRLEETLDALGEAIEARMPIVVLEPSCLSVFHDELGSMLPESEATRCARQQTRTLADLLAPREDLDWQASGGPVLLHGHCHQKATGGMSAEEKLLARIGQEYELLDSGCCGMAGSFGFEHDHYAVSQAIGERVLLPAVRDADAATLIVTDGFSCREQIAQGTHRRAVHLAQALQIAMSAEPPRALPERGVAMDYSDATLRWYELVSAGLVAVGVGLLLTRVTTKGTKA
jgi:Fe-S oxidoreductase